MFIIKHKNIFFLITGALVLASLVSILVFGLRLGLDFTGGTLIEVGYDGARPASNVIVKSLEDSGILDITFS